MASAALATPKGPNVQRVRNFDLQGTIQYQDDCIRDRKYDVLGRVTNIRLGIDDNAEYFRGAAWERISRHSKVYGLTLEWHQNHAPLVAFCSDKQTVVFPEGIPHLPTVAATVMKDIRVDLGEGKTVTARKGENVPRLPQRLSDFASGRLIGARGQGGYLILQPIEQMIVFSHVSTGTLLNLVGAPIFGRHPFLMVNPFSPKAYIAGGSLSFSNK